MNTLDAFKAKFTALRALQTREGIDPDVSKGAKQELGAEFCRALSGPLGQSLLQQYQSEWQRLSQKQFRQGDVVLIRGDEGWEDAVERTVAALISAGIAVDVVERPGSKRLVRVTASLDQCRARDLDQLQELMQSLGTVLGMPAGTAPLEGA